MYDLNEILKTAGVTLESLPEETQSYIKTKMKGAKMFEGKINKGIDVEKSKKALKYTMEDITNRVANDIANDLVKKTEVAPVEEVIPVVEKVEEVIEAEKTEEPEKTEVAPVVEKRKRWGLNILK